MKPDPTPIAGLAATLGAGFSMDEQGRPEHPVVYVDLNSAATPAGVASAVDAVRGSAMVVIGVAAAAVAPHAVPLAESLDCTLVPGDESAEWQVSVADLETAMATISASVAHAPIAAVTAARLLRQVEGLSVDDGLAAESAVYSLLLGSAEFQAWLGQRPARPLSAPADPVRLDREGPSLTITLNVPERHNAFSRWVRDGLVEAFDLVNSDDTIEQVVLRGAGPSFCSGGDLDEFGTTTDPGRSHLIRIDRSVASRLDRRRDRVSVELHGACIGAGIEIASFAGRVRARSDAAIALPELRMGLVPGAGGSVGISRRIGRWRTAYLILTGETIDAARAREWGLVDEVVDA